MATVLPPVRNDISGTAPNPSNAVARTAFGVLHDYLLNLLGNAGTPAAARTALGINTAGPACSAYSGTNQSITSGVLTKVALTTEEFDTNNNFDSTTNYRFTPTVAGYYQVNGLVLGSGTGLTQITCAIYKNGTGYKAAYIRLPSVTDSHVSVSTVLFMNGTTDYLELYGTVAGTTPVLFAGSANTSLSACWLRA